MNSFIGNINTNDLGAREMASWLRAFTAVLENRGSGLTPNTKR